MLVMVEEDGIVHKSVANMDAVLVREKNGLQILVNGENFYSPLQKWSVIIYDLKTDEVVAVLGYDE